MTAERIIATSAAILAGASGIGIGVEGANNSVLTEKGESTNSLLDIDGQVVKSEDEQGESGESVSDGKRFTEDDLGVLTTKHDMIRGKIQRKVQQKKDARTKIKKPRRDRAGVWDYRPSAFAVVRGEKDHAKEQPRALDRMLQEKVQECPYDETNCDCCSGLQSCFAVDPSSSCIGRGSCNEYNGCFDLNGDVGNDSCTAYSACNGLNGTVDNNSCNSDLACEDLNGNVGNNSCNAYDAYDAFACSFLNGDVDNNSCNGNWACSDLNGDVDNNSCNGDFACGFLNGDVGNDSCNYLAACQRLNGTVGAGSCLGERSCSKLEGVVGSNSCTEPAFRDEDTGVYEGGCYGYNGVIPNNCPSVKALEEGNCTTAHPSISAAPSTQPSTSPTSSAAPSSMPSAAPKSGKSSKSPKSKASKNGKALKLSDLEEQSSKAMDYDFIEQMSLPSSLWEESLSMLF